MFAGDKSKPAADASYRNLLWENFQNFPTKILKGKEIGTIDSWGPFFRISFDLNIHSFSTFGQVHASSVLAFKGNGATWDCCANGDRIPFISVSPDSGKPVHLHFANSVNEEGNYYFNHYINFNTWYNIIIEQKSFNGKVMIL